MANLIYETQQLTLIMFLFWTLVSQQFFYPDKSDKCINFNQESRHFGRIIYRRFAPFQFFW